MTLIDNDLLPKMKFPARDRTGVFLGLSGPQVILAAIGVGAVALTMTLGAPLVVLVVVVVVMLPVWALALTTWKGESQLLRLARLVRYLLRKTTGQTQYRRNPWRIFPTTRRATGDTRPAPVVVETPPLPGALGDVAVVQVPGGGAFVHNAKAGLVSVSCTIQSSAWRLRDKSDQVSAYDGIVDWFGGLDSMQGLVDASCRIRVDRASSTELGDYVAARDAEQLATGLFSLTPALEREYNELISIGAQRAMSFTNTVTLTFDTRALGAAIKVHGGGLAGLGELMTSRVRQLHDACGEARVDFDTWLDAPGIIEAFGVAFDPIGAGLRRERNPHEVTPDLPVMGIEETFESIRIDQSVHRTLWITEWPRMDSKVGFLEPLLYTGLSPRVLTLQLRPVPIAKALTRVNQEQSKREMHEAVNLKLRKRTTRQEVREQEDLDQREEDLVDGFSDVQLRGFVTITGDSDEDLARAESEIEQAQHKARVKLASMWGQQAAAFVTAVIPAPTGKK